ncbi:condensin complex protein MksE [Fibrella arboris]|uniref:condensin complex protein MksE n=1 Tax=Fibrella arboris TaxID=3242486 RepID=UPI003522124A
MENDNTENVGYSFLESDHSQQVFSKLDYALKDGIHIQRQGADPELYAYLKKYEDSLQRYYRNLFGVRLEKRGEDDQLYYYLDYHSADQSSIPENHKRQVKNEYIIIGLIVYKIIYFAGNLELSSVSELKKKITLDYEEYENGLLRLIAKSSEKAKLQADDVEIDNMVDSALNQFVRLGWMERNSDYFEPLPSFQRLLYVYEDVIQNIDQIIARY